MSARPMKSLVVWVDYGTEGWQPVEFESLDELQAWVLGSAAHGSEFVVTRLLDVRVTLDE